MNYRGYSIEELAAHSTFEEVFYLLVHEVLPTQVQLTEFVKKIAAAREIPASLEKVLE